MSSTFKPRVLAIIPGFFPSTVIGIAKPLLHLHLQALITLDLRLPFLVNRRRVERSDVVVIGRVLAAPFAKILEWVKSADKPLIHELDDNLVDVPGDIPGLGYARDPDVRRLLIDCLQTAQVVRVYSPDLRHRLSEYNNHVQLVSGPLDWTLIPEPLPARDPKRVRLVYATSRAQDRIGALVVRPLRRALDAFPQAELTVWGPRLEGLSDHPRVRHLAHVGDYDAFLSRFVAEAFDIGLAPLPDDAFHRGKSNNKFREFAAAGVAGLYSDMPVYTAWVTPGQTGWLVPDGEDAWFAALEQAITDVALRTRVAENARRFAREHFNAAITDREWMAAIGPLAATAMTPMRTAARREGEDKPNQPPPRLRRSAEALRAKAEGLSRIGNMVANAFRIIRRDGVRRTAVRAKGLLSSMIEYAHWEFGRWRLERRVAQKLRRSEG